VFYRIAEDSRDRGVASDRQVKSAGDRMSGALGANFFRGEYPTVF
jgi:hypothetical protein